MNQEEILHELKQIATIQKGTKGRGGEKAVAVRDRLVVRLIKIVEEIVANPEKICLKKCNYKEGLDEKFNRDNGSSC